MQEYKNNSTNIVTEYIHKFKSKSISLIAF